jgi:hypothetical protein
MGAQRGLLSFGSSRSNNQGVHAQGPTPAWHRPTGSLRSFAVTGLPAVLGKLVRDRIPAIVRHAGVFAHTTERFRRLAAAV